MEKYQKKFLSWLKVILWMTIIFYFSSQPDLKSSLPNYWDFIFRKIAHLSEYFILTYLSASALKNYKLSFKKLMLFSGTISIVYATTDELHQSFVFGRNGSVIDVLIDSVGVFLFILLSTIKYKRDENLLDK